MNTNVRFRDTSSEARTSASNRIMKYITLARNNPPQDLGASAAPAVRPSKPNVERGGPLTLLFEQYMSLVLSEWSGAG